MGFDCSLMKKEVSALDNTTNIKLTALFYKSSLILNNS